MTEDSEKTSSPGSGEETLSDDVVAGGRLPAATRAERIRSQLDVLATADLDDREDAWR